MDCTCGAKNAKPKHHENGCPIWEQYIGELDAAYQQALKDHARGILFIEIGEAVIFNAPDGYPDRARFMGMQGDLYKIRYRGTPGCPSGNYAVPRSAIIAVVRPKPVAYAERP